MHLAACSCACQCQNNFSSYLISLSNYFCHKGMLAESLLLQLPQATRTRIWCRSEGSWIQLSTWRPLRERRSNCRAPTHLHSSTVSNHCIQKGNKSEWEEYWKLCKDPAADCITLYLAPQFVRKKNPAYLPPFFVTSLFRLGTLWDKESPIQGCSVQLSEALISDWTVSNCCKQNRHGKHDAAVHIPEKEERKSLRKQDALFQNND